MQHEIHNTFPKHKKNFERLPNTSFILKINGFSTNRSEKRCVLNTTLLFELTSFNTHNKSHRFSSVLKAYLKGNPFAQMLCITKTFNTS